MEAAQAPAAMVLPNDKPVFVVGPPGSGKGTLCKMLESLGLGKHVSIGDVFRAEVKAQSDLGKQLEPFVSAGELAPDSLVTKVVQLLPSSAIVDGFPRTLGQAKAVLQRADRLVLLTATDDICVERILHRRVDPITGAIYNDKTRPATNAEVAARLVRRPFDEDEGKIRKRLAVYHETIGDILNLFRGKIQTIETSTLGPEQLAVVLQTLLQQDLMPPPYWKPAVEQCVVCMNKAAEFLVVPCGHLCGCQECLDVLMRQHLPCPICREPIASICKVFHSGILDEDQQIGKDEEVGDGGWGEHDARVQSKSNFKALVASSIKLSVARCSDASAEKVFAVSVLPPDVDERVPVDVCCVVDISGSMAEDAKFQDPEDETKQISMGLSILDLVKHSVKAVIHTLVDHDRLSLVAFDSVGFTAFQLSFMNASGKDSAVLALEKLMPRDSTNLFAGLESGLDSLRLAKDAPEMAVPRKRVLFLLTDGQPTESPPDGEVTELRRYFDKHGRFASISTFGFGYALKSDLLVDLARAGHGSFAFLPDAKVVGTCFVNAIANAVTQFAQSAKLYLVPKEGTTLLHVGGGMVEVEKAENYTVIKLGNLQYGQQRDAIFTASTSGRDDFIVVVLEIEGSGPGAEPIKIRHEALLSLAQETADSRFAFHRALLVDAVHSSIAHCIGGRGVEGVKTLKAAAGKLAVYAAQNGSDVRATGLAGDAQGRCSKALSTIERWNRWGQHFLRAIVRAHEQELCTNFLDFGLQHYGGSLFKQLVDQGGKIFVSLPMKKTADYSNYSPMAPAAGGNAPAAGANAPQAAVYYGGGGGGCFGGDCVVERDDGYFVRVADVRKGDRLRVASGTFSEVECCVSISGAFALVQFAASGLCITPKHPIMVACASWARPIDMVDGHNVFLEPPRECKVFNFVLTEDHRLVVNGTAAVTWGHNIPEAFHGFYGTHRIVDALKKMDGFKNGFVQTTTELLEEASH